MEDFKDIESMLKPRMEIKAPDSLRNRVLSIGESRKHSVKALFRMSVISISTAVVAAVVLGLIFIPGYQAMAQAKDILYDALAVFGSNYNIQMEVRADTEDGFESFDTDCPYTPMVMKRNGHSWSIEKIHRFACGNDSVTYLWIPGKIAFRSRHYGAMTESFVYLLDPIALLNQELVNEDSKSKITETDGEITLRMSDGTSRIRYYVFDSKTHQLKNFKIYLKNKDGEKLVLNTRDISYGDAVLNLKVPENIQWTDIDDINGVFSGMSAKDALRNVLLAFENWDREILSGAFRGYNMTLLKMKYDKAKLISIGEPYSIPDHGKKVLIPYSIRLDNGSIFEHEACFVKSENDGSWIIDGGF